MFSKKEQFEKVNEIITKYNLYLNYLGSKNNFILAMNDNEDREEAISYVARVYHSFISLPKEEKESFTNEFFLKMTPEWWKDRYSETQFRLILFSSINTFLERFNSYAL